MSSHTSAALPVTGAGVFFAGTTIGVQWVAVAGAALVILGFGAIRVSHTVRNRRARAGAAVSR